MSSQITESKICITQGDTLPIILNFHQDITDAVVAMQVRDENGALLIDKKVTEHTDALLGKTMLTLTSADTSIPVGTYQTDMEITFNDGTRYTFYPPHIGKSACFCIAKQITQEETI